MRTKMISSVGAVGAFLVCALSATSWGCGLEWAMPENHFDGVNERGEVSYWTTIDHVDLGNGLNVPIVMGFNSARNFHSPYLGSGWVLALLDSNVVQVDSRHFVMMLPDGLNIRLKRKDEASTTLTGQSKWMAEVGENVITSWAECGWKIVFSGGKIASITTPQNHQITYNYQNGVVQEVDVDSVPVLSVLREANGAVSGLAFNGKQISLKQGDKPVVETINGQKVIGHIDQSLSQVKLADGKTDDFKFAVNQDLLPTLRISGINSRYFSWNPLTGLAMTDGDWSYNIIPGKSILDNASITRKNKAGQAEVWFDDRRTGKEITQGLDGVKQTKEFFTTGILKGKTRKIEQTSSTGQTTVLYAASYDENGHLLRVLEGHYLAAIDKSDNTFTITDVVSGKVLWKIKNATNGPVDILSGLGSMPQQL